MLDLQAVFGYSKETPDAGPAFDYTGWGLKPDLGGRLGLEAPALPDSVAWWRWAEFDGLPQPVWPS